MHRDKGPKYYKVIGNPHLVRDVDSNAILSTNIDALTAYKKQREIKLRTLKMLDEFDDVKSKLANIEMLLEKILLSR
jgi:hypothetical protein